MQDGLAVQAHELLPAHLEEGSEELDKAAQHPMRRGPWDSGGYLVHDGHVSCVGPEAIVHRDKRQTLPAAGEGFL